MLVSIMISIKEYSGYYAHIRLYAYDLHDDD
jgi:hypothetical protein